MNKNKILKEILITLLSIYFSIAICFSVTESISYFSLIVVFIISFIILNIIFPKIVNLKLPTNKEKFNKKELIVYGLIIFVVLLFAFIAFYPAVLKAADTPSQWKEVQSGIYSNWHPFIHTFIFMKLPSLIYNSYASCAIFELIIVGAILLYFCYFLRKYFFNKKGTIITLLLVILNPTFIKMAMYIGKDGPFSYLLFLGTLLLIEIVLTKGEWINKNSHKILLIITSLGIMLVRHNGIANVFLMFVLLIIFLRKKDCFILLR